MAEQVFRIFVSSPGDVAEERRRVDLVVERLNTEFRGRARLETVRWETSYYSAHDTFQKQIPEAANCDLVLALFRARLGTPLPASFPTLPSGEPYPSGTAYEVLSAIEVRRAGQRLPDVYVFRYPHAPSVALDAPDRAEVEAQWDRLRGFFDRWFRTAGGEFLAAFQDYASTDDFARRVEECLRQWLARHGILAQGPLWDRVLHGSPFPGLAAFGAERGGVFFGRELAVARTIERLGEIEAFGEARLPFLLILGASGSGKSSLLRAGLLPRLTLPGTVPAIDLWRTAVVAPGPDPFLSLAEALFTEDALGPELREGTFRSRELLAKQLAGDPDLALPPLRDALARAAETRRAAAGFAACRPARLLLAIDQAERLFTEAEPARAAAFSTLIAALVRGGLATVVMALRSDAYARLQADEALVGLRTAGAAFDLLAPSAAELEEMVSRPVAACRPPLAFETRDGRSLAARLVADAKGGDALPLLQMTLSRLYAAEAGRGDGLLRFADYGGIDAAVTATADEALAALGEEARAELPALVAGLVADVGTDPLTGAAVPAVVGLDRAAFEARRPARAALVGAFVERRLLTAEGDGALERVRPVHEALLRVWPRAVAIVAEVGHLVRIRHTLEPIVRAWAEAPEGERDRHLAISPALLGGAQELVGRFDADVPAATRDFVAAAGAVAEARRREERDAQERRIRDAEALAAANRRIARRTGAGLVVALLLAALAGWQWRSAERERAEAQAQRDRAERTLALATRTANGLVFSLAQKFRDVVGVPAATIEDILDRARQLQEQLLGSGETSMDLRLSQASALLETAVTLRTLGESERALAAARQGRDILAGYADRRPERADLQNAHANALTIIGDIEAVRGHPAEALAAFTRALDIDRRIAEAEPAKTAWQRAEAVSGNKVGDIRFDQADYPGALAAYEAALAITERLAASDPADTLGQSDLATSRQAIASVYAAQGRLAEALAADQAALAIDERLAATDPGNGQWQRNVEVSRIKVGDRQDDLADLASALASYGAAQRIAEQLTRSDPSNKGWQSDLAIVADRIGDVFNGQTRWSEAAASYRAAVAIKQRLAAADPGNAEWRGGEALSQRKIGLVESAAGHAPEALAAHRASLAIRQALAAADPTIASRQADLAAAEDAVADVLVDQEDFAGALPLYKDGIAIEARLSASTPADLARQARLASYHRLVGKIEVSLGRLPDALEDLRAGLAIRERLSEAAPGDRARRRDVANLDDDIAQILSRQDDADGATGAYRAELAAREQIAASAPDDPGAVHDLADADRNLGDALRRQGAVAEALTLYRAQVAALRGRADAAPGDGPSQLDLALAADALSDLLGGEDDQAGALASEEVALDAMTAMTRAEPSDPKWRGYLAIAENKAGEWKAAQGHPDDALTLYRASLALREPLARAAPDDGDLQRQVSTLREDIGDALLSLHDADGALAYYRDAFAVAERLAGADAANPDRQRDLSVAYAKLGAVDRALDRRDEARRAMIAGQAIATRMAALHPETAQFRQDVAWFAEQIAALPD